MGSHNDLISKRQLREDKAWKQYDRRREKHNHRSSLLRKIARPVGTSAMVGVTIISAYGIDVAKGMQALDHTYPSISTVNHELMQRDSTTMVIAGLGNRDSYATASSLPVYEQLGSVWSLRYDNSGIDTEAIALAAIGKAMDEGITQIAFSGHSAGGDISLDVARQIQQSEAPIVVPYVILDCTPPTAESIRPESRDIGYKMAQLLQHIPGARYSNVGRFVVEEIARFEQYRDATNPLLINPKSFAITTLDVIHDKFLSPTAASTSLLESQFNYVIADGARENIMALGQIENGKPKPIVVVLRPSESAADKVVDDEIGEQQLRQFAKEAGLQIMVVEINNTGHANPIQRPLEYNEAIANQVMPNLIPLIEYNRLEAARQSPTQSIAQDSRPRPGK